MPSAAAPAAASAIGAPRAIQRAFGNIVLLGDGADPLAVRIEHLPVDADALFAA